MGRRPIYIKLKVVADPTILLGSNRWNAIVEEKAPLIKGEYVLYYNLMGNSFDDGAIKKFAEERGLKLVVLNGLIKPHNYFDDSIYDADPVEMLNLIKNATVVFTSSYHGLVFSLLFERQVYCGFSHNSVRAESLLNGLGLNDRLLKKGDELPIVDIDYARVRPLLQQLAKDSGDWLEKSLDSK